MIIQFGSSYCTSEYNSASSNFVILPTSYTVKNIRAVGNCGVGNSGWQYMNGVVIWGDLSQIEIQVGAGSGSLDVNWISIGY